ncbi:MAG: 3-deoxy-manno-octulosonate cytidylyltransferase [Thermodesulfovibrionales bacterium]
MAALVVIPARYGSTRFPGKPLAPLKGKPVIQHVYENARGSRLAARVVVATDSEKIAAAVASFGGEAVMTSADHASGTDRAAEVASMEGYSSYDIIVNVQGDEPMVRAEMVDAVAALLADESAPGARAASMGTLARRIESPRELLDPGVVKVVFDPEGFALYFSRAPIPFHRDLWGPGGWPLDGAEAAGFTAFKHVGIYSYRRKALLGLTAAGPSPLEAIEKLEQLRALEGGMRIKVGITPFDTIGVDTPEDLERVEKCLSSSS